MGPGQVTRAPAAGVKAKGLEMRTYSGRGLEQRQVGNGSRDEPTLGQHASKESQTLTGLSAGSPRLEMFIQEGVNCSVQEQGLWSQTAGFKSCLPPFPTLTLDKPTNLLCLAFLICKMGIIMLLMALS